MTYLLLEWMHAPEDEPCRIYAELDDARMEQLRVEEFADGTYLTCALGSSALRSTPYPEDLRELPGNPSVQYITRPQFYFVWDQAQEFNTSFTATLF